MNKKNKILISRLVALTAVSALMTGCSSDEGQGAVSGTAVAKNKDQGQAQDQLAPTKILAIDPHLCTGCGKCARFDPEHFFFNPETRQAEVVSSKNLSTRNLTAAIAVCQTRAISLE